MKVFNTYLKWVELNFQPDTHWMERASMWWGVCGAQSGKRDCTQHFFLKFRCCKTEQEHCKNNICYCSLELDNVVYTSRRIITWAQDAMYWNHLHGEPQALRMWEENDGGSWDSGSPPIDPTDCSLPGSSVHGIFQARTLEWGAIAFSVHAMRCSQKN